MGKGHSGNSKAVKRDPMITYRNKVEAVTKWYNNLVENRKKEIEPINDASHPDKQLRKRAELKDLQFYIDQIKKPKT